MALNLLANVAGAPPPSLRPLAPRPPDPVELGGPQPKFVFCHGRRVLSGSCSCEQGCHHCGDHNKRPHNIGQFPGRDKRSKRPLCGPCSTRYALPGTPNFLCERRASKLSYWCHGGLVLKCFCQAGCLICQQHTRDSSWPQCPALAKPPGLDRGICVFPSDTVIADLNDNIMDRYRLRCDSSPKPQTDALMMWMQIPFERRMTKGLMRACYRPRAPKSQGWRTWKLQIQKTDDMDEAIELARSVIKLDAPTLTIWVEQEVTGRYRTLKH